MNILYTLNSGQPGGMEHHVLDLVKGMTARGHKVYLWCKKGPMEDRFKEAGAEVFEMNVVVDIDPTYIFSLVKFLRDYKIDVLHSHELKASVNSLIGGSIAKTPVRISHVHTPISEWQIPSWKKDINSFIYSLAISLFSTKEIALTQSRKEVKIKEGIKENKLEIIPNGLDTLELNFSEQKKAQYAQEVRERYNIPQDAFVLGAISRITEEKGTSVLVNAFSKFLQNARVDRPVWLFLGGGGKLEESIKKQAQDLGISEKVVLTGRFSNEDHTKFFATPNIFVFPSLAEGFGIVLIEAMTARLPVLCSDLPVLQEVGGSTVRYFETGNSDDLAQKLFNMYQKRDQLSELTEAAFNRVEELYSIEKFNTNYENLYTKLLEENR